MTKVSKSSQIAQELNLNIEPLEDRDAPKLSSILELSHDRTMSVVRKIGG